MIARLLLVALSTFGACVLPMSVWATPPSCSADVTGGALYGGLYSDANVQCLPPPSSGGGPSRPAVRTVDCGPRLPGPITPLAGDGCSEIQSLCELGANQTAAPNTTSTMTQTQQPDGSWVTSGHNCSTPTAATATPASVAHDQIVRLVPHPGIGSAPPGGATLVNIQTLLWLDTSADRDLGAVTLLGRRISLAVSVANVSWDFGDGTRTTTTTPGTPYTDADACTTPQCPHYFGHTYRTAGATTVTATVTWQGHYRVDGGPWLTIQPTVTGPPQSVRLTVKQARSILVPGPADR